MKDEPAFPTGIEVDGGLTKREYFAARAMQGLISTYTINRDGHTKYTAETAVQYADALIAEPEKK